MAWMSFFLSFFFLSSKDIVIRGDWLRKAANINDKNNSAAVYVGILLNVVHFQVHKNI